MHPFFQGSRGLTANTHLVKDHCFAFQRPQSIVLYPKKVDLQHFTMVSSLQMPLNGAILAIIAGMLLIQPLPATASRTRRLFNVSMYYIAALEYCWPGGNLEVELAAITGNDFEIFNFPKRSSAVIDDLRGHK